jgi:hypothetical protein
MGTCSVSKLLILLFTALFLGSELIQCSVTYDKKAIIINGQRRILISGSIHYPRSTPEVCNLFFDFHLKKVVNLWIFVTFGCFCEMGFGVDVGGPYSEGQRWRLGCH